MTNMNTMMNLHRRNGLQLYSRQLRVLIALSLLALFSQRGWAQCPDPSPVPPSTPSWTDAGCETDWLAGTSCQVQICYCTRTVSGEAQFLIKSITPLTSGCTGMTPESLILNTFNTFQSVHRPHTDQVNPCPDTSASRQTYIMATCWSAPVSGSGNTVPYWQYTDANGGYAPLTPCFDQTAWCKQHCTYCKNGTVILPGNCWYESVGTTSCTPIGQTDTWYINQCYDIAPCS